MTTTRKLFAALSTTLLLGACATHPAMVAPPTLLQLDQPFEASWAADEDLRRFRFLAKPGQTVDIKLEADAFYSGFQLYEGERYAFGGILSCFDAGYRNNPVEKPKGGHVRVTLPPGEGDYHLHMARRPDRQMTDSGPYRLTVTQTDEDAADLIDALGRIPPPRTDTVGKFLMPFTEDGTVAPWVEKGLQISVGANVGRSAFMAATQVALGAATMGAAGDLGAHLGAEATVRAVGGWDYIRSSSDTSFDEAFGVLRYSKAKYGKHPDYELVMKFFKVVYQVKGEPIDYAMLSQSCH